MEPNPENSKEDRTVIGVYHLTRAYGERAWIAGVWFAVAAGANLFAGRIPYTFGMAIGLWALARFLVGFTWRDSPILGPLGAEQLYALVVVAIAVVGLIERWRAPLATMVERRPEAEARLA